VGPEVEQEITGYTKMMWGTKKCLRGEVKVPKEAGQAQGEQGVVDKHLNQEITFTHYFFLTSQFPFLHCLWQPY